MGELLKDNVAPLAMAAACTIAAWFLGRIIALYVEARRRRVAELFIEACHEIGKMGKVPDGNGGRGWMRGWWKAACEAAGSGWLSPDELSALRETATRLGLREDFGARWESEGDGAGLPRPEWCALAACGLLCAAAYLAAAMGGGAEAAGGALCASPLLACCLVGITDSDLRFRTIPTELVALLLCIGSGWQLAVGGLQGLVAGMLVACAYALVSEALAVFGPLAGLGSPIGKGDVKLALCGVGACGRGAAVCIACVGLVAAGVLCHRMATGTGDGRSMMPMGPAMCLGITLGCIACVLCPPLLG